ncbi:T4 prohead core scaffold protein [bacterium]|nr:T4 prohead core scaffold protein [bacterium]
MSVGSNLQEMENVVTKGAAAAESMPKAGSNASGVSTPGQGTYEDLGGPTPENYRADDNSAKLKEPTLATVKDIVNKGAKPAESMPKGMKEEEEVEGEVVSEEETTEEEVVSEEETTDEEVVAEEEEVVAEYDIEEDINALLQGEELSEEFEEKARTIFEAAIKAKSTEIQEELTAQYEQALQEEVATIKEELTDRVDAYLEYVAEEWMTENQLAVEQGLKTEMTESFLTGIRSLFEDHYVSIPEEKYDVLNSMVEKLDEMEDKLNEQIERNIALKQRLAESVADVIFSEVCEGLALSQKEKLASLAENVEFDSEDTYREKLVTLRNSYFPANSGTQRDNSENISESADATSPVQVSGLMESYLTTLTRVAKK